jgi:hypothetical protein
VPATGQHLKPAGGQRLRQAVTPGTIECRQRINMFRLLAQHIGNRQLRRGIH